MELYDMYIKRKRDITLQEWLDYVKSDKDLVLVEFGEGYSERVLAKLKEIVKSLGSEVFE